MLEPREISAPIQIAVEGKDTFAFIRSLSKQLGLSSAQLQDFGGVKDFSVFLPALLNTSGFRDQVRCLGIIRDAEDDAVAAFQSVCGVLRKAGLTIPKRPEEFTGGELKIGILILPDSTAPGSLETLCLQGVANDPAIECVSEYFSCLEKTLPILTNSPTKAKLDKARLRVFLASRKRPHLPLGQAIDAGFIPYDSSAFAHIKSFLQALEEHSLLDTSTPGT